MKSQFFLSAALLVVAGSVVEAQAQEVRVREMHVHPLAAPERVQHERDGEPLAAATSVGANATGQATPMAVYPVAGTVGQDITIPYYVDLDPSSVRRDWLCSDLTFNGHSGHDPYLRSFSEQRIGVPVFAVRDGTVIDMRDGEPDENVGGAPGTRANFVTLRHNDSEISQYVHLRKGVMVKVGDTVTAGQQIGWVGSSGPSAGPHIHFEARVNDVPVEPMAGSCRPGHSLFSPQPAAFDQAIVVGTTFSNRSFANYAAPPFDDAPHVGTFVQGRQTIYFKAELANVGASTRYQLLLQRPGSSRELFAAAGSLTSIDVSLASIWWGLEVNLDKAGEWAIVLEINGRRAFAVPFTVVSSHSQVVNRPPNPLRAEIEPVALRANSVAVCRATTSNFLAPDPDYDVVRYRYEWRVNGAVVRDVTTAATSDALARQFVTPSAQISCTITASDGQLSAQPATVNASPVTTSKRRPSRS